MTSKEKILKNIEDQIKAAEVHLAELKKGYVSVKSLPDYIFDNAPVVAQAQLFPGPEMVEEDRQEYDEIDQSYGRNKRLVLLILEEASKAITRDEIETRFKEMIKSNEDERKTINNTLSALVKDGEVLGYRPKDIPIRGKFWTLSRWWSGESIRQAHKPDPADYLEFDDAEE